MNIRLDGHGSIYTPSKEFACGTILVALDMAELKQGQTRSFGHSDGVFSP